MLEKIQGSQKLSFVVSMLGYLIPAILSSAWTQSWLVHMGFGLAGLVAANLLVIKKHGASDFLDAVAAHPALCLTVLVAVACLFMMPQMTHPKVHEFLSFYIFGGLILAVHAMARLMFHAGYSEQFPRILRAGLRILSMGIIGYWIIATFGEIFIAPLGDDHSYLSSVVLAMIAFAVAKGVVGPVQDHHVLQSASLRPAAALIHQKTVSDRDKKFIAAHEAGHALLFAAMQNRPKDLRLSMSKEIHDFVPLGCVSWGVINHLKRPQEVELQMLIDLAGQMGERAMHGDSILGANSDIEKWMGNAKSYLTNKIDQIFYVTPANEEESRINETRLQQLRESQLQTLKTFFEANQEAHRAMADKLLEKGQLGLEEIEPILSQVKLTPGIPLLASQ